MTETAGIITFDSLKDDNPFGFKPQEEKKEEVIVPEVIAITEEEDKSSLNNENKNNGGEGSEEEEGVQSIQDREKQTLEPISTSPNQELYRSSLRKLNVSSVAQEDENGETVEIPIEELDIDEELYTDIIRQLVESEKEEVSKDKISIKGVSELTKNITAALIEIDKNGGDNTSILHNKQAYLDPLDSLDLDTTEGQRQAVEMLLRNDGKGRDSFEIKAIIKSYEENGLLRDRALESDEIIRKTFSDFVEKQKKLAEDQKKENEEKLKVYRKDFKKELDTHFELKDTVKAKIADFATPKAGDGSLAEFDKRMMEVRFNPSLSAELALWLMDREEYIRQITNKKLTEQKVSTAIKAGTIRIRRSSESEPKTQKNESSGGMFIPLE
jgi:hypothetical protein